MLYQGDNYGFSIPVLFRSKAQCEGNGQLSIFMALGEHWNAVAGHHRDALRVSLSMPTDCIACMDVGEGREQDAVSFAPLDKGVAIACEARLAVNVDKLTELEIITLIGHSL